MATITVDLIDGLFVDGLAHKSVILQSVTAGDLEDAAIESERVIRLDDGPAIAISPVLMANAVLVRQIKKIGDIENITPRMLRSLSAVDIELLQAAAETLDAASRRAVEAALMRGRSDEPAAGVQHSDGSAQ